MFFFFMFLFRFLNYLSRFSLAKKLQAICWRFLGEPMVNHVKANREARDSKAALAEIQKKKVD